MTMKQTYSEIINHTTDAGFRAWATNLSTALQACGLVKTADTGQINLTTVTRAGAGGLAGYEIYRFNDALQATRPIFVRVEYRTGSSPDSAQIQVTFGTGTNGAGTLAGVTVSTNTSTTNATPPVGAIPTYVTLSGSALVIAWAINYNTTTAAGGGIYICDRFRDESGAATSEGMYVLFIAGNNGNWYNVNFGLGTKQNGVGGMCLTPHYTQYPNASVGANVEVFNHYAWTPAPRQILACLTYFSGDISGLSQFTVTHLGASHNYLALGDGGLRVTDMWGTNSSVSRLAVLWED